MSMRVAPTVPRPGSQVDRCNLWDSPLLRVRRRGEPAVLSLREIIRSAELIDGLDVALPTQEVAILRQLLLPIVLEIFGPVRSEQDWVDRFRRGTFIGRPADREALDAYEEEWRSRFDLFDPVAPFAQVGGLVSTKGELKTPAVLVPTCATGNNVPLFAAVTENDPYSLSLPDAFVWLLHTHCWDTAAIKTGAAGDPAVRQGKTTGNPVGALGGLGVVVSGGANLFETLMLNTPIVTDSGQMGRPQWTRSPAGPQWRIRPATGLLDLLTWQSRRIRLVPELRGSEMRVVGALVAAGDRLEMVPGYEPHTLWRAAPAARGASVVVPARHRPGRAAWRGLDSLLAVQSMAIDEAHSRTSMLLTQLADLQAGGALPDDFPLQVLVCGMVYGNKSAVVEDVVADRIPMPILALSADTEVRQVVLDCATQADELATAVNLLEGDLRRCLAGEPTPWNKGERPGERLVQNLDRRVRALLAALRHPPEPDFLESGRLAWEQVAWRETTAVADQVIAAFPPRVFRGHTDKSGRTVMREADAHSRFNRRLRTTLPRAYEALVKKEGHGQDPA